MTPHCNPFRVLALVASSSVLASAGWAQAPGKTPFTPPQAIQQAAAPSAPTQLEFRAFMDAGDGPQFRIVEPAKKTGVWLKVGEKGSEMDVVVKKFDGDRKLDVEFQGRALTLTLREGKVISGGNAAQMMPAMPAMPAPPPPTNVAPAVTQSVVVNPTPADEQKRLEAVAAEVARRRALREQASNTVQNAPPPPGPSATATQNIAPPPPPGNR